MDNDRLPKRPMSGRLGAAKRGLGAWEKTWLDEVDKGEKAFDITGDWRQRVTQAPEWHAAVKEGAQTSMDRWKADEADKAEARRKERETKRVGVDATSVGDGLGVGATTQEEVQQELHARVAQFQPPLGC